MSPGTTLPAVEARGLRKSYVFGRNRLEVLRNLDLTLAPGQLLAIVGVSGVGKTTLLNILGLMDRPDEGEFLFAGRNVAEYRNDERDRFRNLHCGFVFQAHHLLPEFSALENAAMPLWIRGVPPARAEIRVKPLLERLGLKDRMDHRPPELSGGERQRVALARAFAGDPALVLADEPTGNLDPETAETVFGLFRDMHRDQGVSTVLVTHNPDLAAAADRVAVLRGGRLEFSK